MLFFVNFLMVAFAIGNDDILKTDASVVFFHRFHAFQILYFLIAGWAYITENFTFFDDFFGE